MGIKNKRIGGVSADAVLLTFIKLITTVLGLLITRLLSQYLEVYDYGTYSQIMLIVSTVSAITVFGMVDGVNFFYAGEPDHDKRESYIATLFALQCTVSTIAGAIVMLLCRPICVYFDNPDVGKFIIFAALLPFLQNILGMSHALFVAVGKARLLAYRNLAISLIKLISVMIVVWVVQSITVVLITSVILDVCQIAFFWIILRKNNCQLKLNKICPSYIGRIVRYCAPMAVYLIVNSVNRDLDKYTVSMLTDTETLAMYANASKQLPFDIIMASFCTVLIPYITSYISQNKKEKATELYRLFLEIAYITTGILCCAALSAAPQLMKLLYSNKYTGADGIAIFCIYILVDLFRFTNITLVLSAAGKTKRLMLLGFGALVFNALTNVVLFKIMGLIGPAVATLVTTLILGMLMMGFGAKVLGSRLSNFFDLKYLALFVLESLVLTFVMSRLQVFLEAKDVHYFVILVIVAGLYGISMLLLNGQRLISALKKVNDI